MNRILVYGLITVIDGTIAQVYGRVHEEGASGYVMLNTENLKPEEVEEIILGLNSGGEIERDKRVLYQKLMPKTDHDTLQLEFGNNSSKNTKI